jgi:hypothetical protein
MLSTVVHVLVPQPAVSLLVGFGLSVLGATVVHVVFNVLV